MSAERFDSGVAGSAPVSLVTRQQALAQGWTVSAIRHNVGCGRWQRLHHGVYLTHSGSPTWLERAHAALLAAGPDAVLSHRSAAYLDGLIDDPPDLIDVTLPRQQWRRTSLPGVRLRCSSRLPTTRHPARTPTRTRVEDTVLDLVSESVSAAAVAGWVTRACQRRLTTPARLVVALASRQRQRWRRLVASMLADVAAGAESPLELEHLRRVERAHGLPPGRRQTRARAADGRPIWIDVDYADQGTRVELDGRVGHVGEGAFRDRRRDNRAAVDGKITLRYGWSEVFGQPCEVAAEQATVLANRGWTGRPRPCGPACPLPGPPQA